MTDGERTSIRERESERNTVRDGQESEMREISVFFSEIAAGFTLFRIKAGADAAP